MNQPTFDDGFITDLKQLNKKYTKGEKQNDMTGRTGIARPGLLADAIGFHNKYS